MGVDDYTKTGPFVTAAAPGITFTFLNNIENWVASLNAGLGLIDIDGELSVVGSGGQQSKGAVNVRLPTNTIEGDEDPAVWPIGVTMQRVTSVAGGYPNPDGVVVSFKRTDAETNQLFMAGNGQTPGLWFRGPDGGGWSAWINLYPTGYELSNGTLFIPDPATVAWDTSEAIVQTHAVLLPDANVGDLVTVEVDVEVEFVAITAKWVQMAVTVNGSALSSQVRKRFDTGTKDYWTIASKFKNFEALIADVGGPQVQIAVHAKTEVGLEAPDAMTLNWRVVGRGFVDA